MFKIDPPPEPKSFNQECRLKGQKWLKEHPEKAKDGRPKNFWSKFLPDLAEGFSYRCAYSSMHCPVLGASVDHYIPVSKAPEKAYEWSNYRYASQLMNSIKKDALILDPFVVEPGWFKILLPSLQLVAVPEKIPPEYRELAEYSIKRLKLVDDERIIKTRRSWLKQYEEKKISLDFLRIVAPMIADAIEEQEAIRNSASD